MTDNGEDYRGAQTKTKSGVDCDTWDSHKEVSSFRSENYPDAGLTDNFCRNPDGKDKTIWCHSGAEDWDYCEPLAQ